MRRSCPAIAAIVAALLVSLPALGATVYRWVDEAGKVHYSEVVPERYRGAAKPIDTSANAPTAEQQREALERAQQDKARAAAAAADRARLPASAAPAAPAPRPAGKRPAQVPNDRTDCETWQRLYFESIECFGPYRTVRGGIKPEAFDRCNLVPEPPPDRCRLRSP
ncbi:MAG: DUF4124 domain-containing protein [Burkholderiales bacterium]|nr:DUF4124 domain-containing protein [Burkholderiales bacterium]